MTCAICNKVEGNSLHEVREMIFGSRDPFTYTECGDCGCLWLVDVPADMAKYYPTEYYSLSSRPRLPQNRVTRLLRVEKDRLTPYAVFGKGLIGRAVYAAYPNDALRALSRAPGYTGLRVLDVGCGSWSARRRYGERCTDGQLGTKTRNES